MSKIVAIFDRLEAGKLEDWVDLSFRNSVFSMLQFGA
jgi:hypothetical protein